MTKSNNTRKSLINGSFIYEKECWRKDCKNKCALHDDYCENCIEAVNNYNKNPEETVLDIPSIDLPKGFVWIYFVQLEGLEYIKIGKAGKLKNRLSGLNTNFPKELVLLCKFIAFDHVERMLHGMFKADRERGEWFRESDDLIMFMKNINIGYIPEYLNHAGINTNPEIKSRIKIINRYNKT